MALTKVTKELIGDSDLTISGGTVDNSVIGGSTAAAGTFTTLQGTTITATTAFVPDASDGAALGTTSLEFSDLYLADGALIYFGDDQDINITHVADTGLTTSGTFQATTITATTAFVPDASGGADIGSASAEFGDIYIADDKYINFGSDQNIVIGYDENGNDTLEVKANVEGAALGITFSADEADDNADTWKVNFADGGTITWQSYTSGSFVTKQTIDTSGNLTMAGTVSDADGAVRAIPQSGSAKTSAYTLVAGDVGNFIEVGASGSIVVPASVFSAGDAISVFNNTTGDVTITCSAITTAYKAGDDSDVNSVTLETRGIATILFIAATVCVISGNLS